MTNIYILKLEGDKYYIGKSDDVLSIYQQHLNGSYCEWTKLYPPKFIIKTIINVNPSEIYQIFNKYINEYGILKVRSDNLQSVVLQPITIETLRNNRNLIKTI